MGVGGIFNACKERSIQILLNRNTTHLLAPRWVAVCFRKRMDNITIQWHNFSNRGVVSRPNRYQIWEVLRNFLTWSLLIFIYFCSISSRFRALLRAMGHVNCVTHWVQRNNQAYKSWKSGKSRSTFSSSMVRKREPPWEHCGHAEDLAHHDLSLLMRSVADSLPSRYPWNSVIEINDRHMLAN